MPERPEVTVVTGKMRDSSDTRRRRTAKVSATIVTHVESLELALKADIFCYQGSTCTNCRQLKVPSSGLLESDRSSDDHCS